MKNILVSFQAVINYNVGRVVINVTADACYRLEINDQICSHGPARCGKGTWRVDEIDVTSALKQGENKINISVLNYGVVSYEYVMQNPFLQAEVFCNDRTVIYTGVTGGFVAKRNLSRERVTKRYSYQRPFLEVWHLPTYWVLSDSNNSKGDLNLIHSKNPDIWEEKIGYEKITSLNELQSNNWTQLSYTFTANGESVRAEIQNR